jgi:hypothetical protein
VAVAGWAALPGVLIATTTGGGAFIAIDCWSWNSHACPADMNPSIAALAAPPTRSFRIVASIA